jgi:hypothetical protein
MDADVKIDPALGRKANITLDHAALDLDGAAHRIDYAAELEIESSCAFDDAAMMGGDGRINEIAAQAAKAGEPAILVGARQRLYPTTSATRIAASFRVSPIGPLWLSASYHKRRPNLPKFMSY